MILKRGQSLGKHFPPPKGQKGRQTGDAVAIAGTFRQLRAEVALTTEPLMPSLTGREFRCT